ncbi:alpha/beta fold hydrolase [Pseudomonas gingeri]|uniref:Alpha/beta hydrolase n=1 Tax=Pseudomonas gingeri TaxID=117681 RepID=A0A7Y7WMU6_9PSED|nr:alpha/beta hydrolase [Pseudomonas gingeri]NWB84097.1 alpha/beta hydrolase [Pseudomonas gingeri]
MGWGVGVALFAAANAALWAISSRINRSIEAAVPAEGRFIEVGGEWIHYVDEGSGPALVMIHGLSGCGRNLTYALSPRLREQFRVITLDRPGSGYSSRHSGAEVDIPAQARLIAEFIGKLDLDRPLVLGHSLGGALALSLALDHPQSVSGLVLVAPLTHPQPLLPPVFLSLGVRPAFLRRWFARVLATPIGMLGRKALIRAVFAPEPAPTDFAERGGGLLGMRSDNFYCASSEIATVNNDLPDMVRRYPSLKLPVGLIYGSKDRVLNYRKQGESMLGKLPGLSLEIVEGAGHMLPVTAVEPVVELVRSIALRAKPQAGLAVDQATPVLGAS